MIRGDDSHTITIEGNGNTIDADNAGRVFFVESGTVAINDLTIANAMAQGGKGGNVAPASVAAVAVAAVSVPVRRCSSTTARW